LARQLGAHHYIDSRAQDPAAALRELGGAKVVLATVTSGSAMTAVLGGLAPRGTLMIIGVTEPLKINPLPLILGSKSVRGWYSGTSIDSQETLAFSALSGVRPMTETFPLEHAADAYDRMMSGEARFRVVLTTGN
jgi:D-arabinose 1-dehydrogenase-like Zn-dependent alcohol dehydrogenase